MKYTVDTNSKIINIESAMSSEELKGLCEQYPDYSFIWSSFNYIPYYPTTAPIAPYYNPYFGTVFSRSGFLTGTNLLGTAISGSTDTTQGFAVKTTLNN